MLGLNRKVIGSLGVALLVAVVGVSSVAFADDPVPTTTPTTGTATTTTQRTDYKQVFLGKLATALGLSQSDLEAKLKTSEIATIDQAVADGNLAKNPADEMKARIEQGGAGFLGFGGLGGRGIGGPGIGGRGMGDRGTGGIVDNAAVRKAVADKLGLSVADLQTQVRSKTLADLAKAKAVAEADLYTVAAAAAKPQLDQAVKDGKLTQTQADAMLKQIQDGELPLGGKGMR